MNNLIRHTVRAVRHNNQNAIFNNLRRKSTYKAVVLKGPGKLEIEEKSQSALKANQVRVQINYCCVNSVDVHKFNEGHSDPFVPGYEFSGEVTELGKDVGAATAQIGEKIVGLNLEKFCAFAEECVIDANDVFRLPNELSDKDAAVIVGGHTLAVYAFSKIAPIKEKDYVVVSTGPAGLGLAAVDVAANIYSAKVIGVIDDEALGDLVRSRGAFSTVHFDPKLSKNVSSASEGKGASVVYDAVGEHMMESIGNCVKIGGKVLYASPYFYTTIPAPIPHSFATIVSLRSLRQQNNNLYKTMISDTLELASQGVISAHVSAKFDLTDIQKAIDFIKAKKCTGKVLIKVED